MSSIYARFVNTTDEPVILAERDFAGLEKEIDIFDLETDTSSECIYAHAHRWSSKRAYILQDICIGTTVGYYAKDNSTIDCLEIKIPDLVLVGASGLISPFWALLVNKIKINFICFNQYIELPFVRGITLKQIIDDPIAVSKKIGNRIIIATDRQNKAVIRVIYDNCKEFEKQIKREAKTIKSLISEKKKTTTTITTTTKISTTITTTIEKTTTTTKSTVNKYESAPDVARCIIDDIEYWDRLNSLSEEERSYYGWERDPQ